MEATPRQRRRRLRFDCLDDILEAAELIANSPHVQQLGNWTPGQIFEHLAKSFNSSIDQSQAIAPFRIRLLARLLRPIVLRVGLPSGFSIKKTSEVAASEFLPADAVSTEAGMQMIRKAIERLQTHSMTARHNMFGDMTQGQWLQMHCRHAELHFSFLIPEPATP